MTFLQRSYKLLTTLLLVLVFTVTTACSSATATGPNTSLPAGQTSTSYSQLSRGNTAAGQDFGSWVVSTAKGLVQDAYVRDNNKLGVMITPQVRPDEVRPLAKSILQGFQRNFPDRDLTVLMYASDKKLILTARYDSQSRQVQYQ